MKPSHRCLLFQSREFSTQITQMTKRRKSMIFSFEVCSIWKTWNSIATQYNVSINQIENQIPTTTHLFILQINRKWNAERHPSDRNVVQKVNNDSECLNKRSQSERLQIETTSVARIVVNVSKWANDKLKIKQNKCVRNLSMARTCRAMCKRWLGKKKCQPKYKIVACIQHTQFDTLGRSKFICLRWKSIDFSVVFFLLSIDKFICRLSLSICQMRFFFSSFVVFFQRDLKLNCWYVSNLFCAICWCVPVVDVCWNTKLLSSWFPIRVNLIDLVAFCETRKDLFFF